MPVQAEWMPESGLNKEISANHRLAKQFEEEREGGFEDKVRMLMLDIGVPARHIKSMLSKIPPEIAKLRCLQSFPSVEFGIVGPPGCGKTSAIAYYLKRVLAREFEEAGPDHYEGTKLIRAKTTEFKWIGWPAMASKMKGLAARREWEAQGATVQPLVDWLASDRDRNRVLILDDVGMEVIRPDSYTSEQLELLVDSVYNMEGRLIWTSNRSVNWLANPEHGYGERMMSRLVGTAPDAELPPDMPDLRVRRV